MTSTARDPRANVTKPVVLIAEELSPATVEALGPDFEIRHCNGADRAELLPAIADVDAVLVRSATKIDAEALAAAKRLKVVARAGVGLDNVDVKEATQSGVMVVNAPTSNIVSAAELAVGLLLAAARNIAPANAALKQGEWKRSKYTGIELYEKTVGIVGLGKIGVLVAQRLSAFGFARCAPLLLIVHGLEKNRFVALADEGGCLSGRRGRISRIALLQQSGLRLDSNRRFHHPQQGRLFPVLLRRH